MRGTPNVREEYSRGLAVTWAILPCGGSLQSHQKSKGRRLLASAQLSRLDMKGTWFTATVNRLLPPLLRH